MSSMDKKITSVSEYSCHNGSIGFYSHEACSTECPMRFSVYQPPLARSSRVPALYFLAGLTCTEETFMIKAGAQRLAARLGLILVTCDTSPRGLDLPGDTDHWDFGVGASFYIDATEKPWSRHYRMATYINDELPDVIEANFPALPDCRGLFGHSVGGHGALVNALRNPDRWQSVSAFAPVCNPVAVPWGEKAFRHYLGGELSRWAEWDASLLMASHSYPGEILVDQGERDEFFHSQLHPDALANSATASGQHLTLRRHPDYDHSYWFIQTFIEDHLTHHARLLGLTEAK